MHPDRREFLKTVAGVSAAAGLSVFETSDRVAAKEVATGPTVRTVLGRIDPQRLGATLMHEHAPIVDWSELYEVPIGPYDSIRGDLVAETTKLLQRFVKSAAGFPGEPALVECTPIRVGRYPDLLVELAKVCGVHIIACTGFWCEAMAPQHPWAIRMGLEKSGVAKIAELYVREITEGMEDPHGQWGERFTKVPVGIIKCATSTWMRPSERRCHIAAAIASRETGCPITTHTTNGGGLEQAQLFLANGAKPEKVIIGHQGNLDDREDDDSHEYHRRIVGLGCNIQFDRVGHAEKYGNDKLARQIRELVDAGHVSRILVAHDHVPYFYEPYTEQKKSTDGWKFNNSDFTVCTTGLVESLTKAGVSDAQIQTILVDNPQRVLAF
jgi:phosphotriesterase-related protein